jgi:alpha-L-fucosidase 2
VEALPLGNGSLGAMCYSGIKEDKISLNHDTLWTGHPQKVTKPGAYEAYHRAQALALDGKYREAQQELEQHWHRLAKRWTEAMPP